MIHMPDQAAITALGLSAPRKIDASVIGGYNTKQAFSGVKFVCDGDTYVASGGQAIVVDPPAVAHLPGKSVSFSDDFCYNLVQSSSTLGRFMHVASTKSYYLIDSGKKRLIANYAAYINLVGEQLPAVDVDASLAARFANGAAAPSKMPTSNASSTPAVGGSTTSGGSSSSGTSTGTGSTGGTTTKTPTISKYTVKAGDSQFDCLQIRHHARKHYESKQDCQRQQHSGWSGPDHSKVLDLWLWQNRS